MAMYHGSPTRRDTWTAISEPSLSALTASILIVGLGPVLGAYLAGNLALGGGLLLGLGLAHRFVRLDDWEGEAPEQTSPGRSAEIPVWFESISGVQPTTAEPPSN